MTRQIVENSSTGICHALMPGASPLASTREGYLVYSLYHLYLSCKRKKYKNVWFKM